MRATARLRYRTPSAFADTRSATAAARSNHSIAFEASPARLVVRRDLGADRVEVRGTEQLERLGDAPVEQPPPAGADARVRGFADAVMAEVVAVETLLADDVALPQLVERADEGGLLELARLFEHVEGERATDGGGDLERFGGFLGQLVETRPDRGQDPRRQPADRRIVVARPVEGGQPAAGHLHDVQRMALRLSIDVVSGGRRPHPRRAAGWPAARSRPRSGPAGPPRSAGRARAGRRGAPSAIGWNVPHRTGRPPR